MNDELKKPYNPTETEKNIYQKWEESGYFNPDICVEKGVTSKTADYFSIVLPPPNVTGTLHTGHALMLVIEDILTRSSRMKGFKTLWLPGVDHAAIATQSKVEKELAKEKIYKKDLGREEFLKRVESFAQNSRETIIKQVKKMGASVDWSRMAFTLDKERSKAVEEAFKQMYDDGLIYRGERIVNWDPKGQTVISDDEIVYKEEKTKFYYLQYGPFVIGTARPETKFGDKYVVMHPADTRYKDYKHGDQIELEWINGPITATVIKDESIDMEFGTGVMTITPAHSVIDFEIAEKHKLDKEKIIDQYGKLLPIAGEFSGAKITEAREKIVEKLKNKGLLVREEDYVHNIATAERSEGTIEPQIMSQWFVAVNKPSKSSGRTLKELMMEAVKSGEIKIIPDRFEKVYFHWIENLRDWCISRQIWYGHRIPAWYKRNDIFVGSKPPSSEWVQDEDTLDTWFSSGLWTFSTLGWPEKTSDLKNYHPTTILETGYDILFFWVARMILMSKYFLKQVPFKTVYLHGLVRDAKGRKMSKSLGNIIDPLDLIEKYGADALRMAMIVGNPPGNDLNLAEDKIKAYKHFANKIWNIARFVLENSNLSDAKIEYTKDDSAILESFQQVSNEIMKDMESFRFYMAAEKLYAYVWHQFADIIIEESKKVFKDGSEEEVASRKKLLYSIFEDILKLLHPFMPFITEKIWSFLPNKKNMLIVETWPRV